MKRLALLLLSCSLLSVSGCNRSPVVTKAEFDQLETGQTYDQVKGIIGDPGKETMHDVAAGIMTGTHQTLTAYTWTNPDGSMASAEFENDKLTSKMQTGLK
jgi:Domain of Unknown Function with PDB structure (DUF3862)